MMQSRVSVKYLLHNLDSIKEKGDDVEEIKKLGLKMKAFEGIGGDTGIYPMGDKPDTTEEMKETDNYKRGWNDCALDQARKLDNIAKKDWGKLTDDVLLLLASDSCYFVHSDLCVMLNDTFAFAYADAEEIPKDEIKEVADLYRQYGCMGPIYWASKRRNWLMPNESEASFKYTKKEIKRIRKEQSKLEKFARGAYKEGGN